MRLPMTAFAGMRAPSTCRPMHSAISCWAAHPSQKPAPPRAHVPATIPTGRKPITLKIAPHPQLTTAQARAIAMDYGIRGASTTLSVRRALLFYALKRLGLDVADNIRSPQEQHIVLLNRAEVDAALGRRTEP